MPVHPVMAGKFHLLEGVSSIPELFENPALARVQTMLHGFLNLPASIEPVGDALDLIAEAVAGRVRPGGGAR